MQVTFSPAQLCLRHLYIGFVSLALFCSKANPYNLPSFRFFTIFSIPVTLSRPISLGWWHRYAHRVHCIELRDRLRVIRGKFLGEELASSPRVFLYIKKDHFLV